MEGLISKSPADPLPEGVTGPPERLDQRHQADPHEDHSNGQTWMALPVQYGIDELKTKHSSQLL